MLERIVPLEREDLRARLVASLVRTREGGVRDPEVMKLLDEWTARAEKAVPPNQPERNKAAILLNVERARLYRDSGYIQEAIENYEAALTQLGNEADRKFADDTVEIIYAEMDAMPQN